MSDDLNMHIPTNKSFDFMISDNYGVDESSTHLHWHPQLEICYIKKGSGKYIINGHHYIFNPGDIFLINNDEIHLAYDDVDLIMQVMMFHPDILWSKGGNIMDYEYLRPFFETEYNYGNLIKSDNPFSNKIISILVEIENEYQIKSYGYQLMIKSLLLKLMTTILRCLGVSDDIDRFITHNDSNNLRNVFEFINDNYLNTITLEQLSDIASMSISYFSTMFKKYTGLSPIDFIIRKRLIHAKELLTTTNQKIIQISQECGFSTITNFNKLFKKYTDMTPSQYRKK